MENLDFITQVDSSTEYRSYQGGYFKVLVSPEQTAGSMAVVDFTLPKGCEPPMHIHEHEDETFYLLEGQVSVFTGDEKVTLNPGEAAFAPRQVRHTFQIETAQARMIIMVTPGDFMNFFIDFSEPADSDNLQITPPQGPPPAEYIQQMVKRLDEAYQVYFV